MYECEKGQGSLLSAIILITILIIIPPRACKIESAGFGHFIHDPSLSYAAAGCQNGIFCGRKLEEEEEEEGGRPALHSESEDGVGGGVLGGIS